MQILNRDLIKKSEESAVLGGAFSFRTLMGIAGRTAAEKICERIDLSGKRIAVLCGNGNNGGDGFCVADYLYGKGALVTVVTPFGLPKTENALYYYNELEFVEKSDVFSPYNNYDIIIDALFGIGFNRTPDDNTARLFDTVNNCNGYKIAIDIPSGVDCDNGRVYTSAIKADLTVTFIALKPCFVLPDGSDYCGETIVADIGVKPIDYTFLTTSEPIFSKRRHNSHKGSYGTALLINGSYGMAGAAILAAKAALKIGLGIAKCVLCDKIYTPFTVSVPEAVCLPVSTTENGTIDSTKLDFSTVFDKCDAVLFGCGVKNDKHTEKILLDVIKSGIPSVIDADGINILAHCIDILKECKKEVILTPHPGEMARLMKKSVAEVEQDRVNIARNFAIKYGCVLVLKGANTIIASPNGEIFFNMTGNPGMATGGSGDLLSGIMVSLLAQGFSALDSAKAAVYLHGKAGDKAAEKKGERALLPSDMLEVL